MEFYFSGEALQGRSGHEAGRELLQKLYFQATGQPLPPIAVADGGKPYFPGSSWHFSISHTPRHAFCALAQHPIGIDAEELDRQVSPRLAGRILSETEYAQYAAATDKPRALLTFWVLKEAHGKFLGTGIQYPHHQTHFSLTDSRVQTHSGCLVAIIREDTYAF